MYPEKLHGVFYNGYFHSGVFVKCKWSVEVEADTCVAVTGSRGAPLLAWLPVGLLFVARVNNRTRQDKTRQECAVRRPLENACAGHLVWNCGALICTDV